MKDKIIIIGATGETGMYITDYFVSNISKEYEIIAVGLRKTDFFKKYGIQYYSIDINKPDDFDVLPKERVHAVIYTAAVMPGRMEGYSPMKYLRTNVCGTLNVLEYCKKVCVDRIIFTQTIRDIGNKIGKETLLSDTPRDFSYTGDHAVYVISKNAAVDLIEHYYQQYGIKRFIFRLPTIYMYTPNKYYYVDGQKRIMGFRKIIDDVINGNDVEIWGDPTKAHDIVYVKDLAKLFFLACFCENNNGGIYNVGTGHKISLQDQINGVIKVFSSNGKNSKVLYCPEKPNARSYDIDISKIQNEFGFSPSYSYEEYLYDFKKEMELGRFKALFDE